MIMVQAKRTVRNLLFAIVLLVFPAGYVVVHASDGGAAVKAFLADPMSFFSARSPGARGAQPFATTKPGYAKREKDRPDPGIQPPDSEAFLEPPAGMKPDVPFDTQFAGNPFDNALPAQFLPFSVAGENFYGPPELFFDPEVAYPIRLPPLITDPPITGSSLPEADTWLMMIIGFFATGSALRLRKKVTGDRA